MTGAVQVLNGHLYQLGWNWQHPRIKGYLEVVAQGLKREKFQSISEVPERYIRCLIKLCHLYHECDKSIKILDLTWESEDIRLIMQPWGYGDKMPLKGWEQLYEWLNDNYPF